MKKFLLITCPIITFFLLMPQMSIMAANENEIINKDLRGLNYYDFYVNYINDYYKDYDYFDHNIGIYNLSDLNLWFNKTASNCFYDWCLQNVDINNDSILSEEELNAITIIDDSSDPTHLLGRNAVDYHFDWFPNLERLELNNPTWRYLIGNKNLALELNYNYITYDIIPSSNYLYDNNNPFAHLYLPHTGNLKKVDIKNSEMLFFNYTTEEGQTMPDITIEGMVFGDKHHYNNSLPATTDIFDLEKYIANGFDINRIIDIDNAQLTTDEAGKPILKFNNGAQEAHMRYLISSDPITGKQNICQSTIRINPQTQWRLKEQMAIHEGESVDLDIEHFPDENFREWLHAYVDTNNDNILSFEELGKITAIRAYAFSYFYQASDDLYYTNFQGEDIFMKIRDFKGIEYLYNLQAMAIGELEPTGNKFYEVRYLDLSHNMFLEYFYLGLYTPAIDIKLPDTYYHERMIYSYYITNIGTVVGNGASGNYTNRLVTLDQNNSYDLEEDIEHGLDPNRLAVIDGGCFQDNKIIFNEPVVTIQYIARPPIMGGPVYGSKEKIYAYFCLYNFITTRLYDANYFDNQSMVEDLSGINTITTDDNVARHIYYYNLNGVRSTVPFKGFNIKVTNWSNGTTSSEKIMR